LPEKIIIVWLAFVPIGPLGTGKSTLSRRLTTTLPQLALEEALETAKTHHIVSLTKPRQMLVTFPSIALPRGELPHSRPVILKACWS
jgi:predicted ATPase with chaperone activity